MHNNNSNTNINDFNINLMEVIKKENQQEQKAVKIIFIVNGKFLKNYDMKTKKLNFTEKEEEAGTTDYWQVGIYQFIIDKLIEENLHEQTTIKIKLIDNAKNKAAQN